MKRVLYILISGLIAFTFNPDKANASHLMGSDLSFSCIGKDSFLITLNVYRDCRGANLGPSTIINISSSCGSNNLTIYRDTLYNITPVSSSSCSRCDGFCSFNMGIEKHIYTGLLVLPVNSCCEFNVSWTICCRNPSDNYIGQPIYYSEMKLNRCITPCNNSPRFDLDPISFLCKGQDIVVNPGITETDGDSIVYLLSPALTSGGILVSYISPYSYLEPLSYLGIDTFGRNAALPYGFYLDSITGDLMFRPTKIEGNVIKIIINEYRNNSLISEVYRDLMFYILDCPANMTPVLDSPFVFLAYANIEIDIPVTIWDPDSTGSIPDSVFLDWNHGIPAGSFEAYPAPIRTSGNFKWTPTVSDVRTMPYRFTAIGHDNASPFNAYTSRAYSITVLPFEDFFPDLNGPEMACINDTITVIFDDYNSHLHYNWQCSGSANCNVDDSIAIINFSSDDTAFIKVTITLPDTSLYLDREMFILVNPLPENPMITGPTEVCLGQSFKYTIDNYVNTYDYLWNCTGSAVCDSIGTPDILINFNSFNNNNIKVSVTSTEGCKSKDSLSNILIHPIPDEPVILGNSEICLGDSSLYTIDNYMSSYNYSWKCLGSAKCDVSNTSSKWVTFNSLINNSIEVTVTSTDGCISKSNKSVIVNPKPDVPVLSGNTEFCEGDSALFIIDNYNSIFNYIWNCNGAAACSNISGANLWLNFNIADSGSIKVDVNYQNKCFAQGTVKNINVNPLPQTPVISGSTVSCIDDSVLVSIDNYDSEIDYIWHCSGSANCDHAQGISSFVKFTSDDKAVIKISAITGKGCSVKSNILEINVLKIIEAVKPEIDGADTAFANTSSSYVVVNSEPGNEYIWKCTYPAECINASGIFATVNFKSAGIGIIEVTAKTECSKKSITKQVIVEQAQSIENLSALSSVEIHPNPGEGSFTLRISTLNSVSLDIVVFNSIGQRVYTKHYENINANIDIPLLLNDMPTGSYYLQLKAGKDKVVKKIEIVR